MGSAVAGQLCPLIHLQAKPRKLHPLQLSLHPDHNITLTLLAPPPTTTTTHMRPSCCFRLMGVYHQAGNQNTTTSMVTQDQAHRQPGSLPAPQVRFQLKPAAPPSLALLSRLSRHSSSSTTNITNTTIPAALTPAAGAPAAAHPAAAGCAGPPAGWPRGQRRAHTHQLSVLRVPGLTCGT